MEPFATVRVDIGWGWGLRQALVAFDTRNEIGNFRQIRSRVMVPMKHKRSLIKAKTDPVYSFLIPGFTRTMPYSSEPQVTPAPHNTSNLIQRSTFLTKKNTSQNPLLIAAFWHWLLISECIQHCNNSQHGNEKVGHH